MATIVSRNMQQATLFMLQQIYISVYALVAGPSGRTFSKAWVCGSSPAEIVDSIPTGGMNVRLLWVLCVVR